MSWLCGWLGRDPHEGLTVRCCPPQMSKHPLARFDRYLRHQKFVVTVR
jgi:hypothetical protein